MKMNFIRTQIKLVFTRRVFALSLLLIVTVIGNRKCPVGLIFELVIKSSRCCLVGDPEFLISKPIIAII